MKPFNAFRRLDDRLLRKRPVLWVLGVHIYIPLVILIAIILFILGASYSLTPLPRWGDFKDFYTSLNLIMTLPTIMLAILFIIRQVKFNSKRIHTSLPYRHSFTTFIYYFIVMVFITAMPMAGNVGAFMRAELELDIATYEADREVIDHNYAHMYRGKRAIDSGKYRYSDDPYYDDSREYTIYQYNATKDSIIFFRNSVARYYGRGYLDTISLDQARKEIRDFKEVAVRYGASFDQRTPDEMIRASCLAPKVYLQNSNDTHIAYNHIGNSEAFHAALNFNDHYRSHDGPYFVLEFEFWKFYLLLALGLAVLLIILCSVRIADFGWAMLITALQPTAFGIIFALILFALPNFHNDEEQVAFVLLLLFTAFAVFVAFFSNFKSTFRKAYAICLHIYIPLLITLFLALIRELRDCCSRLYAEVHCDCVELLGHGDFEDFLFVTAVVSAIVATYFFGRFYRRIYINPQSK
jgi:hypothetical protein